VYQKLFSYISVIDEASDFKFGMELGMPRPIIQSHKKKSERRPGVGELLKIWRFSFNIYTVATLATSNLVHSLGLPKPITKSHPWEKLEWHWARGAPQIPGFPYKLATSNFACSWGLPGPIIKSHA